MVEESLEEIDESFAPDPTAPSNELEAYLKDPITTLSTVDIVTIGSSATLQEAVDLMNSKRIGALLVVDSGNIAGIFTERDVLTKIVGRQLKLADHKVADYMTKDPETLPETAIVAFALNKMVVGGFRHVPIVDKDGNPAGIVSMREIMDHLVDHFSEVILNLPPEPDLAFRGRDGG